MTRPIEEEISKRQQELFDYIRSYYNMKHYPPTRREMAAKLKLTSPAPIQWLIKALERKGYIKVSTKLHRGIKILK